MDFYGKHRRPVLEEGKMDTTSKTETAGYIPAEKLIESFIVAGRRLDASRKQQFDFDEGETIPDDFVDPTRAPGYDLADASLATQAVGTRLRDQAREARKQKAETKPPESPPKEE